ncbi:MAG: 4-hydroxythreonine-4-phosphate dehydrogenase PdxA [Magnetovibrionaceae bacterium]
MTRPNAKDTNGRGNLKPPFALTMGDPAGIGGEIAVRAWKALRGSDATFFSIDDPDRLAALGEAVKVPVQVIASPQDAPLVFDAALPVLEQPLKQKVKPGKPNVAAGRTVLKSIKRAVELAMAEEAAGVITNPINKSVLYEGGFKYPGHTELLGHMAGNVPTAMLLSGPSLRVVPVTVHQSLRAALDSLTTEAIVETGLIAAEDLRRRFRVKKPRIAVAGLNPHAGEDGSLGREEIEIVAPAVEALKDKGVDAFGPVPPDALFTPQARQGYDLALCLYHDQALIPLKALDFDQAVNVTLGLPFIRTSPDHGTAYDIAGTGKARPDSLVAAIRMAQDMAFGRGAPLPVGKPPKALSKQRRNAR